VALNCWCVGRFKLFPRIKLRQEPPSGYLRIRCAKGRWNSRLGSWHYVFPITCCRYRCRRARILSVTGQFSAL